MFDGTDVTGMTPRQMLDRGVLLRAAGSPSEGLVMVRGARENISLPSLGLPPFSAGPFLDRAAEKAQALDLAKRLNLQPLNIERAVESFSGGNQQKVLLAKALSREVQAVRVRRADRRRRRRHARRHLQVHRRAVRGRRGDLC